MLTGEFTLIDKISQRASGRAEVRLGIGDDCSALLISPEHELLTSTDLLLEGVHFRLDWTDLRSLGLKAVAVNVSDIAAMGGTPLALYLGVGLPLDFRDAQVEALLDGIFAGLQTYDLSLAGGDTSRSTGPLIISVTVQGSALRNRAITRGGAASGDDLWVSGTLGDSALALRRLQGGCPVSTFLADRHFRPVARVQLGERLLAQKTATAMLDLSDGLCGDLGHMLRASKVGARVELEKIPLSGEFRSAVKADPALFDLALCGGEDYELLFSANITARTEIAEISHEVRLPLQRIGQITSGSERQIYLKNGQVYQPQLTAFDHFSAIKD
ncbi:thiamine-phosphate kinase [Geopsychrobacter electrodiphilus]|uniref:thiamine-phosphate kinase n=1 Tax=Geopsychrobacter electrodiphilus TaxID=225196 RepID=UPI00036F959F|nr:thiamine-phosphate kinase [Geopsychrobacter electrodiphilus]